MWSDVSHQSTPSICFCSSLPVKMWYSMCVSKLSITFPEPRSTLLTGLATKKRNELIKRKAVQLMKQFWAAFCYRIWPHGPDTVLSVTAAHHHMTVWYWTQAWPSHHWSSQTWRCLFSTALISVAKWLPITWPGDVILGWLFSQPLTQPGLLCETETCTLTNSSKAVSVEQRKQEPFPPKLNKSTKNTRPVGPRGCSSLRYSLTQISEIPPVLDRFRVTLGTGEQTTKGSETKRSARVASVNLLT